MIHAYVSETHMLQGNSRHIIRKLQGHENESIANKLQGLIRLMIPVYNDVKYHIHLIGK